MQSHRVIVHGRRPTSLIRLRWQIACLGMVLTILSAWPTIVGGGFFVETVQRSVSGGKLCAAWPGWSAIPWALSDARRYRRKPW